MDGETLPQGGVTLRKYAAIFLALATARGALYSIEEKTEEVKRILNITATAHIATVLGYRESDLAIVSDDHLSYDEINRIESL